MKKKYLFTCCLLLAFLGAQSQYPSGGTARKFGGSSLNIGHFYGKVVDSSTNKGLGEATVQLTGNIFDTATRKLKKAILATVLTKPNGDFSMDNLPIFGNFNLIISSVGFKDYVSMVSFGIKFSRGGNGSESGSASPQNRMQQFLGMADKDLGNIKLKEDASTLKTVTVTASKPFFEMGVDRKIFNVSKDLVSTGQTATEVMKQIPTLNVDIDGNVTLRNATPQIFIDDRPTTLTLDEIPADIIDRVELITNPSAKYDASGGNGGIINIVLKKNKKTGYNGGVRFGLDAHGKLNLGGDFNVRQNKINFFANGDYHQRESKISSSTDRYNLTNPPTEVSQAGNGINNGYFEFLRAGIDYLIDIRNTLTVSGVLVHGNFNNNQPLFTDSLQNGQPLSSSNVGSSSAFDFKHYGGQLSFKHNFARNGHDITADVNYNTSNNSNTSNVNTYTYDTQNNLKFNPVLQQTIGNGYNRDFTIQSDYENPVTDHAKFETGVRAAIRNYGNNSDQFFYNDSAKEYIQIPGISSRYKFTDQVFAAYADYSIQAKKWNYELGLRLESSDYNGTSLDSNLTFRVNYPLSLFPSAFVTYKIGNGQDLQVNYSRRINRPNFFQLSPIINISDPQNISVGNPGLKPEFTNSFEASYDKTYNHNGNFLATVYFKYSTDLITSYVYKAISPVNVSDTAFFNTYVNANSSYIFGLELTNKFTIARIWDLTLNANLFDSKINGSNIETGLSNQGVSWFAKMNNNFKLPKNYTIQLSGSYQAKTVLPPTSGNGGYGRYGNNNISSAQGYINPHYGFDLAVRKEWTWKGGNTITASLGMNDIFRTNTYSNYAVSRFFTQTSDRIRDPQLLRLNLSYRFGKFDVSLFKRKDNKASQNIDENGMMGGQ